MPRVKRAARDIEDKPVVRRRKKARKLDYKALWKYAGTLIQRQVRARLQRSRQARSRQFHIKQQELLSDAVNSWYNSSQQRLLNAFKRFAPATRWVWTTLSKVRTSLALAQEAEAKRLVTCRCGGDLTSSWDVAQKECRSCSLGLIGNICYCTSYQEEQLTCSGCNTPGRKDAPAAKQSLCWVDRPPFQKYFPRMYKIYENSRYYHH